MIQATTILTRNAGRAYRSVFTSTVNIQRKATEKMKFFFVKKIPREVSREITLCGGDENQFLMRILTALPKQPDDRLKPKDFSVKRKIFFGKPDFMGIVEVLGWLLSYWANGSSLPVDLEDAADWMQYLFHVASSSIPKGQGATKLVIANAISNAMFSAYIPPEPKEPRHPERCAFVDTDLPEGMECPNCGSSNNHGKR